MVKKMVALVAEDRCPQVDWNQFGVKNLTELMINMQSNVSLTE
jgi:hypothetical protein